jgi:hypothetical protein
MSGDEYPTDWELKRATVFARDDYRCHSCGLIEGSESNLEAHHVIPIEDGGTHEMANLSTICSDCFEILHGHEEPPALGSDSDSPSINSYTDLYQTLQETHSMILNECNVNLAGFNPDNDLGSVVNVYEGDRGDTVDGLRKSKRKLGKVDPHRDGRLGPSVSGGRRSVSRDLEKLDQSAGFDA